jgi:hypothetical protein
MRIKASDVVVGVGVGVADQLAEKYDTDRGKTAGFDGIDGWGRVVVTGLGFLGQMMGYKPELSRTVAIASTPLLTKTVMKQAMRWTGMGTSVARPRVTRSAPSPGKVSWRPVAIN